MLGDRIKQLRKMKGFTQEEFAIKLNVVRQTVSKWEKGISVPDAIMIEKIADILDVTVNEILGGNINNEYDKNDISNQLAKINEQLVIKNRKSNIIWKLLAIILISIIAVNIFLIITGVVSSKEFEITQRQEIVKID